MTVFSRSLRISLGRHLRSLMDVAPRHRLEQDSITIDRSSMPSFNDLITTDDEFLRYLFSISLTDHSHQLGAYRRSTSLLAPCVFQI